VRPGADGKNHEQHVIESPAASGALGVVSVDTRQVTTSPPVQVDTRKPAAAAAVKVNTGSPAKPK
jgi:hypothetical protein